MPIFFRFPPSFKKRAGPVNLLEINSTHPSCCFNSTWSTSDIYIGKHQNLDISSGVPARCLATVAKELFTSGHVVLFTSGRVVL